MLFTAIVVETVVRQVVYEVEADSMSEAVDKALAGDTVNEIPGKDVEVADRQVGTVAPMIPADAEGAAA
jgi:hypothetical protein